VGGSQASRKPSGGRGRRNGGGSSLRSRWSRILLTTEDSVMAATMRRRPSGQAGQASPQEASAEQSAAQVLLEGLEDEGGWRASPDVLRGVTEGVEVVADDAVQLGRFGSMTLVADG